MMKRTLHQVWWRVLLYFMKQLQGKAFYFSAGSYPKWSQERWNAFPKGSSSPGRQVITRGVLAKMEWI
jgi:hypothetical protein